ncbi:cytochrome c-type biogenesis protein CcmH [candidate division KSB1 bacterium]|nr:cytochrome c-type biogenesis protein CcmH [candidate division KSB1 bacterium]
MKKTIALFFFLLMANFLTAQTDPTPEKRSLQTEIQNELACFCGCGMTIQGCLGGMTCSESRAVSKEVAALLENGKGKTEVLQAMVAQYGESILAAPTKEGFNLTAWILPFVALIVGGFIVAKVISGWKQQAHRSTQLQTAAPKQAEQTSVSNQYAERLERELREFDR